MSVFLYVCIAVSLTVVAFIAAMLGIGGGVSYTPIQIFFDINIHEAATTSLFLIIVLSISATLIYRRAKRVDWLMAIVLEIFTAAGGFAGGYLSDFISEMFLTILLIVVLASAGLVMLRRGTLHQHMYQGEAWHLWRRTVGGESYTLNMFFALPISLMAGAISGMVGIGGGVLKVPMMVILFGVPIDIAIATSAFMVGITAAAGFSGHAIAGHWDYRMSLILTPGVILGATLGAKSMLKVKKARLKRVFGFFVLLIAIVLSLKVLI